MFSEFRQVEMNFSGYFIVYGFFSFFGQMITQGIFHNATQDDIQHGILLLLQNGSSVSLNEAWEDRSLSNPTIVTSPLSNPSTLTNKHLWSVQEIIEDGGTFRSSIIDQLNETTVTEIVFRLYNKNGAELKEFYFMPGPTNHIYDFVPDPTLIPRAKIIYKRNPDMAIVKADDTNRVAFFHYNQGPRDNMTSFGQQFLFSTGYKQTSTPAFPAAENQGCFEIFFNNNFESNNNIRKLHECTSICLGTTSWRFAIAPNSENFSCVCLASDGYSMSEMSPIACETFCDDGGTCGGFIDDPIYIASVYTLVPVLEVLERISNETSYSSNDTFISPDQTWVSFDNLVYIIGLEVSERIVPYGLYQLSYSGGSCGNATSWIPVTNLNGNLKNFEVNKFHKLEPIPVQCLNISMAVFEVKYYHVYIEYVTEDFLLASYLAVFVSWIEPPEIATTTSLSPLPAQPSSIPPGCSLTDLMSHADVIPSDNVTISYQQVHESLESFPNITRTVPSKATDFLTAQFLDNPEFWVEEISVWSDQEFSLKINLNTSQICTNQYSGGTMDVSRTFSLSQDNVSGGGTYSYELANLKGYLRMFCVSFVEIETWITQAEDNPVSFALETTVTGCKINRGDKTIDTCSTHDLLRDVDMESRVSIKWRLDQSNVYDNSYTHGQHFQLHAWANPSVTITSANPTMMLKQVTVEGNVFLMTVVTDKSMTHVTKQSTSQPTVAVDFGGIIETSRVVIHPFKADSTTDDYYNFTLQIIGCMPAAYTTTTQISSSPMTSTIPSTSSSNGSQPTAVSSVSTDSQVTTDYLVTTDSQVTKDSLLTSEVPSRPPRNATTDDAICCTSYCQSNVSITQEEIEQRIEALIADLTIPKYNISALRRRKESANDSRPSAIAVGTSCGVVFLTMTGLFIVIIDLDHVIAVFRYFRRVL